MNFCPKHSMYQNTILLNLHSYKSKSIKNISNKYYSNQSLILNILLSLLLDSLLLLLSLLNM